MLLRKIRSVCGMKLRYQVVRLSVCAMYPTRAWEHISLAWRHILQTKNYLQRTRKYPECAYR